MKCLSFDSHKVVAMKLFGPFYLRKEVNESRYRPGVSHRVPGS